MEYTPALTHCICPKLQPCQLLCRHTYSTQYINYILQSFGPSAGPRAYAHYIVLNSISFIDLLHLYKGELIQHSVGIQYIQYAAYQLYLWKALALQLVREHMHTIYSKSSYSTSFIDPLHLCKGEPIWHSLGTYTVCSILIISLEGFGPSAGLRHMHTI